MIVASEWINNLNAREGYGDIHHCPRRVEPYRDWRGIRRHVRTTTAIALYLNVFVGIVQAFLKVPGLRAIAPTQSEPPFVITQLAALTLFVILAVVAAKRFRV